MTVWGVFDVKEAKRVHPNWFMTKKKAENWKAKVAPNKDNYIILPDGMICAIAEKIYALLGEAPYDIKVEDIKRMVIKDYLDIDI